jgi:His/Glu/Gln/Arg/opine family amino acid ABC transporter permease subunit
VLLLLTVLLARPVGAAGTLERVRASGELRIGTDATYPPFEFKPESDLVGFDVEVGDEIARRIGAEAKWSVVAWDGAFAGLETGKYDLLISGISITAERKKTLGFSRPYFLSGQTIARRKGDERISTSKDIPGKIVAVQQETTGQTAAEKLGVPKERIHRFDTLQDALTDVRNAKSDAAIGDLPALAHILRQSYSELELTGGIFVHENLGIVSRKADVDLIAAVNRALGEMLVDGSYARIYKKWIGDPVTTEMIAELEREKGAGTPVPAALLKSSGPKGTAPLPGGEDEAEPSSALSLRWDQLGAALPRLLDGARLTVVLTACTLLLGIPLGLLIALLRIASIPPVRALAVAYVEVVRGTPLLMQIYVIYFVLPAVGIRLDSFLAGVAALSFNAGAYISEIFRAGIESIETGQMEAARSLGMTYGGAMRWVILPQTLRRVLPPLTNEAVALLKDSSLVSVVALTELMRQGRELATNAGSPMTIYLAVALIYLAMTLPLTYLVRRLEARWQPVHRLRPAVGKAKG